MSQIERKKLIKSTAFKQQPRGGTDMRKALAGRQTMCRALKNGENKQLWVMGTPISNFQNDSTQLSLGNACLSTERWPLQSAPAGISSALPWVGPKAILPFCTMVYLRTAPSQLLVSRDTPQVLHGNSSSTPLPSVKQQNIYTSTTICTGSGSHRDLAGKGCQRSPSLTHSRASTEQGLEQSIF